MGIKLTKGVSVSPSSGIEGGFTNKVKNQESNSGLTKVDLQVADLSNSRLAAIKSWWHEPPKVLRLLPFRIVGALVHLVLEVVKRVFNGIVDLLGRGEDDADPRARLESLLAKASNRFEGVTAAGEEVGMLENFVLYKVRNGGINPNDAEAIRRSANTAAAVASTGFLAIDGAYRDGAGIVAEEAPEDGLTSTVQALADIRDTALDIKTAATRAAQSVTSLIAEYNAAHEEVIKVAAQDAERRNACAKAVESRLGLGSS